MRKSKFGRESYGCPKLALSIRRGGAEIRAYPHFPFCLDLLNFGTRRSALMVLGTHILGPWPSHNHKQTTQ